MSNNYGVEVPAGKPGYPTQKHVDEILNRIDDCPSCKDIEALIALGEEAAREYIRMKFEELQAEMKAYFDEIFKRIEARLKPLKPLVEPPQDLQGVIEYCKALVEYYTEPYKMMIEMVKFYTEFCTAATMAITNKANEMKCFTNLQVLLPSVPDMEIPELPEAPKPDVPDIT